MDDNCNVTWLLQWYEERIRDRALQCESSRRESSPSATSTASSSMSTQSLKFLDLPPEVRNRIYELVMTGSSSSPSMQDSGSDTDSPDTSRESSLVCPFILQCSPGKRKYGYSLTQTSHQIRTETLAMWHARAELLFVLRQVNVKYYINWLRRRPTDIDVIGAMRRFRIEDYQHARGACPEAHPGFCRAAIVINLNKKARPVMWKRDRGCWWCGGKERGVDAAVERVRKVVGSLEWREGEGRWVLTRDKLVEVFAAAGWEL